MQYRQTKAAAMTMNSEYRFTRNIINEGIILKKGRRVRYTFLKSFHARLKITKIDLDKYDLKK